MRTWFENRWDLLRTNFWFMPAVMGLLAAAACVALILVDTRFALEFEGTLRWLRMGTAPGLRTFLAALTGSVVTVLALVFSITIVVLTLAASQLGPRLLRNFMRDRANQTVLGVFVATFVYTLIALLALGRLEQNGIAPHLTTLGAFAFAIWSIAVLVYFIHHVAESIQAPNVIESVAAELEAIIVRQYPTLADDEEEPPCPEQSLPPEVGTIVSEASLYIQAVEEGRLLAAARDHDVVVRTLHRPGDFVVRGDALLAVHGEAEPDAALLERLRDSFIFGHCRTATQDVEFVLMQLVEIALRALSPGLNDPMTAMTCLDRIGSALSLLAERRMPSSKRCDGEGRLRLVLDGTSYSGVCAAALDQIRQHARANAAVSIRLLETIAVVAGHIRNADQREALRAQAEMVQRGGATLEESRDREAIDRRYRHATELLDAMTRRDGASGSAGT